MKLPAPIKHALIEANISLYAESKPSFRTNEKPLIFKIPMAQILEDTKYFNITKSDIQATIMENPNSLSFIEDSGAVQFILPFTRICNLYDSILDDIKANTSTNPKFTIGYDPAIKEALIYHFFTGSIVLMVPEDMSNLSQLKFALKAGGSMLRAIIDVTGGWIYVFPQCIMESQECGKIPAKDTNVEEVLASYLNDMFSEDA